MDTLGTGFNAAASAAAVAPGGGAASAASAPPSQPVKKKGIPRKKKKKKKKNKDEGSKSKASSSKRSSSTTNNAASLVGAGPGGNGNSGVVAPPPAAAPPVPPARPAPPTPVPSGSGGHGGGSSGPLMQQQGHQPTQPTSQEDDPPVEVEAKVEGLLASYELLELGVSSGLETDEAKDRINDVTESWLELASSGRLSQAQIDRIRSNCTLSLATAATGKRKGSSSTGTGGSSSGSGRSGGSSSSSNNKRRSKGSSTAGGGKKENGDGHGDEQEPVVYSPDEAELMFKQAKEYLLEMMAKRADFLNGSDDGYDSPYLLVRLPSLMAQTQERISGYYEGDYEQPIDQCIRTGISDHIDLLDLGMNSAVSFLDTGDKAWLPVTFTSLASLANDLEELCVPTVAESHTRLEVKSAVMHAKKSGQFDLPTNQSPKNLAKHFLTMNVATKTYLLVMVHCAAGCGMFNSLDIEDLTTGKDPIVSREVLTILDYDKESIPERTDDLLKSYRKAFDCFSNSQSDKILLMASFLRIRQEIHNLSDDLWKSMEKHGSSSETDSGPITSHSRRYFNTKARKTNAMVALTMLTASTFIYEHTSSEVDYGDDLTGVDILMYQNTIPFLYQCVGTKLLMLKTYDGSASEEYMQSVYTGLGNLAAKAVTGSGKGSGTTMYFDDISVLFDLDNDDEEDHDELLAVYGYDIDSDGVGGGDDMDVEDSVDM